MSHEYHALIMRRLHVLNHTAIAFLSLGVSRIPLSLASGFFFTMARRYQTGWLLCFLYHSAYTTVSFAFAFWRASLCIYFDLHLQGACILACNPTSLGADGIGVDSKC